MVLWFNVYMTTTATSLPTIISFTDFIDSGEYGNARCPHCGAEGRYTYIFETTEGTRGAMAGCVKLFPYNANARRQMTQVRNAGIARVARDTFLATYPAAAALLDYSGPNEFLSSLREQLLRKGSLSERQVEAYLRSVERTAERAAQRAADEQAHPATPAPSGKVTVIGEVLSTKVQSSAYGDTLKMLVRDDRGFKVWVSVPSTLAAVQPGMRITFSATLEVSDRDQCFAFGKRPTKAQAL
jgi:hypothetical protein